MMILDFVFWFDFLNLIGYKASYLNGPMKSNLKQINNPMQLWNLHEMNDIYASFMVLYVFYTSRFIVNRLYYTILYYTILHYGDIFFALLHSLPHKVLF